MKKTGWYLGWLALVGLCLCGAFTRADSHQTPPVILTEGTPIPLELAQTIKSNGTGQGDPIVFHVVSDVLSSDASHTLFIAKGAIAMGHVIVASRRSEFGKAGRLTFAIDYVVAVNGGRVYLRSDVAGGSGASNETLSIATGVVVSSMGFLIQGHDKKYEVGTPFTTYVDQDAKLVPAAR